jgi:hypothetical protein
MLAQGAQPRRQNVCGYSLRRAQEIVEVPLATQQVTHDQQRPAIADDVQVDATAQSERRTCLFFSHAS